VPCRLRGRAWEPVRPAEAVTHGLTLFRCGRLDASMTPRSCARNHSVATQNETHWTPGNGRPWGQVAIHSECVGCDVGAKNLEAHPGQGAALHGLRTRQEKKEEPAGTKATQRIQPGETLGVFKVRKVWVGRMELECTICGSVCTRDRNQRSYVAKSSRCQKCRPAAMVQINPGDEVGIFRVLQVQGERVKVRCERCQTAEWRKKNYANMRRAAFCRNCPPNFKPNKWRGHKKAPKYVPETFGKGSVERKRKSDPSPT
jgi:hypothetical protein